MKISIGSDHRGVALKGLIIKECVEVEVNGKLYSIEWHDVGADSAERTDYPLYAKKVVSDITAGHTEYGVLICGSGVGMAVAANRTPGIYAALCWSPEIATIAHEDDGVNVLALSSDYISSDENLVIVRAMLIAWAQQAFKGGRYADRLKMIDE